MTPGVYKAYPQSCVKQNVTRNDRISIMYKVWSHPTWLHISWYCMAHLGSLAHGMRGTCLLWQWFRWVPRKALLLSSFSPSCTGSGWEPSENAVLSFNSGLLCSTLCWRALKENAIMTSYLVIANFLRSWWKQGSCGKISLCLYS